MNTVGTALQHHRCKAVDAQKNVSDTQLDDDYPSCLLQQKQQRDDAVRLISTGMHPSVDVMHPHGVR